MSLGENLQYLRKRENITQEQLAEKLDVSRQSVSKWESDTTYPEMDKLIQLCQMFHSSMDDLIQGNIQDINVEGKEEYEDHMNRFSKYISAAVGLILFGLSLTLILYGCNFFLGGIMKEEFTGLIFFIILTISVAILIVTGIQHSDYINKHPLLENFYTQKEIDTFNKKFSIMIAAGVTVILIGLIIILGVETIYPQFEANEYLDSLISAAFMLCVTFGTTILIYTGLQKEKYNIDAYNKAHDTSSDAYKKNKLIGSVCACIMLVATIIFFLFGFTVDGGFGMPYVLVFAVGGICCAIASIIINYKK